MFVEIQLSADIFARSVRNRLKAIPLALDMSFADENGAMLVVDQVVIGASTTIQRERQLDAKGVEVPAATQNVWTFTPKGLFSFIVPFVQVRQQVSVLLVTDRDLDANGPAPSAPARIFDISVVFNIDVSGNPTQGGPVMMAYHLAFVSYGSGSSAVPAPLRPILNQMIAGVRVPPTTVNFQGLDRLLRRQVLVRNAGIACDPAGTRVAIRADFEMEHTAASITRAFFEAGPQDLLHGDDWAMLVDQALLVSEAERRARRGLENRAGMRLISGPAVRWDPIATSLRMTAEVRLLGVCPQFVDDTDLNVRVDVTSRWSLAEQDPETLVTEHHLDHETTDAGQVFACAVTSALLFPFVGTALFLSDPDFNLGDFAGGIAFAPFLGIANLIGYINSRQIEDDISGSLGDTCTKVDNKTYRCTTLAPMVQQLSPGHDSILSKRHILGVADGLVLSGPVLNLPETDDGEIGDILVSPFTWQILGSCTGNGKNNFTVGNQARIIVPLTPPAALAVVRLLPPSSGYTITATAGDIVVTPSDPPPQYPCRIRLVTGRGVRTITLAPAAVRTPEQSAALEQDRLAAAARCYYNERQYTQIEKIHWLIDPPERALTAPVGFWQVLVRGADPADTLIARDPSGVTVATAVPAVSGTVHLSLMFSEEDIPSELTLELERPAGHPARELKVSTHQLIYELRSTVPVDADVRNLQLNGSIRDPELIIEATNRTDVWNLANPKSPVLTQSVATSGDSILTRGGTDFRMQKVLGFTRTETVRDGDVMKIMDVNGSGEPMQIQVISARASFGESAATMIGMVRLDVPESLVRIYAVAGQSGRGRHPRADSQRS